MRPVQSLVHSRTRVRGRYALLPLEGFPVSRLPTWPDAQVKVLASPALGAQFAQYLIELPAGKEGVFPADDSTETFYFVLSGVGEFLDRRGTEQGLSAGSFGLTPPGRATYVSAIDAMKLIVLRKKYESAPGIEMFKGVYGNEADVKKEVWGDNPNSLLQTLIPDEFAHDMAMNIFTFTPGYGLPIIETHVMEHGLYFLQGKGVYYLENEWMEVEQDDFIWMGPYCPQSFYTTGPTSSRYLYYKNVNRDIVL
jgi:(S)-ureidoglycine aminohydrolase